MSRLSAPRTKLQPWRVHLSVASDVLANGLVASASWVAAESPRGPVKRLALPGGGGGGGGFGRGGGGGGPGGFGMLPIDIDSFQLFFDVTTKTRPGAKVTFLLPHLNGSEDEGCGS